MAIDETVAPGYQLETLWKNARDLDDYGYSTIPDTAPYNRNGILDVAFNDEELGINEANNIDLDSVQDRIYPAFVDANQREQADFVVGAKHYLVIN